MGFFVVVVMLLVRIYFLFQLIFLNTEVQLTLKFVIVFFSINANIYLNYLQWVVTSHPLFK